MENTKLKPLHDFKLDGPGMHQCKGVVAQKREHSASQSRMLQRKKELLAQLKMKDRDVKFERLRTQESIHRTSVASDQDLAERDQDFMHDETQVWVNKLAGEYPPDEEDEEVFDEFGNELDVVEVQDNEPSTLTSDVKLSDSPERMEPEVQDTTQENGCQDTKGNDEDNDEVLAAKEDSDVREEETEDKIKENEDVVEDVAQERQESEDRTEVTQQQEVVKEASEETGTEVQNDNVSEKVDEEIKETSDAKVDVDESKTDVDVSSEKEGTAEENSDVSKHGEISGEINEEKEKVDKVTVGPETINNDGDQVIETKAEPDKEVTLVSNEKEQEKNVDEKTTSHIEVQTETEVREDVEGREEGKSKEDVSTSVAATPVQDKESETVSVNDVDAVIEENTEVQNVTMDTDKTDDSTQMMDVKKEDVSAAGDETETKGKLTDSKDSATKTMDDQTGAKDCETETKDKTETGNEIKVDENIDGRVQTPKAVDSECATGNTEMNGEVADVQNDLSNIYITQSEFQSDSGVSKDISEETAENNETSLNENLSDEKVVSTKDGGHIESTETKDEDGLEAVAMGDKEEKSTEDGGQIENTVTKDEDVQKTVAKGDKEDEDEQKDADDKDGDHGNNGSHGDKKDDNDPSGGSSGGGDAGGAGDGGDHGDSGGYQGNSGSDGGGGGGNDGGDDNKKDGGDKKDEGEKDEEENQDATQDEDESKIISSEKKGAKQSSSDSDEYCDFCGLDADMCICPSIKLKTKTKVKQTLTPKSATNKDTTQQIDSRSKQKSDYKPKYDKAEFEWIAMDKMLSQTLNDYEHELSMATRARPTSAQVHSRTVLPVVAGRKSVLASSNTKTSQRPQSAKFYSEKKKMIKPRAHANPTRSDVSELDPDSELDKIVSEYKEMFGKSDAGVRFSSDDESDNDDYSNDDISSLIPDTQKLWLDSALGAPQQTRSHLTTHTTHKHELSHDGTKHSGSAYCLDQSSDKKVSHDSTCDSGHVSEAVSLAGDIDEEDKIFATDDEESLDSIKKKSDSLQKQLDVWELKSVKSNEDQPENLEVVAKPKTLVKPKIPRTDISVPVAPFPPLSFRINARPPDGQLYYFAYGAEMNPNRMATYIGHEIGHRLWGILFGFKLRFNKKGSDLEAGGFPNIECDSTSSVEGCVYLLNQSELSSLDKFMGYPEHYTRIVLPVWMMNCRQPNELGIAQYCVPAVIYVAQDRWTQDDEGCILSYDYSLNQCLKGSDLLSDSYKDHLSSLRHLHQPQLVPTTAAS
ncbi:uncharacterized protein LOC144441359 [Glandiceps talaboti]